MYVSGSESCRPEALRAIGLEGAAQGSEKLEASAVVVTASSCIIWYMYKCTKDVEKPTTKLEDAEVGQGIA
jgi:hypothetical protein